MNGGLERLDAGLAWQFKKYAHEELPRDRIDYEAPEERKAADRIGVCQDKNPVPPGRGDINIVDGGR